MPTWLNAYGVSRMPDKQVVDEKGRLRLSRKAAVAEDALGASEDGEAGEREVEEALS